MAEISRGRHLRGALVALHLLAVSLMAFPAPGGGMNRSAWKDPSVQGELAEWADRLTVFGFSGDVEAFEEWLWTAANTLMKGRAKVLAPFGPYYRYCGTWQSWRMFAAPHRYPAKLHIDVREDGEWKPIYVNGEAEHGWARDIIESDRMRSVIFRYSWKRYGRDWTRLSNWFAVRIAQDYPDADRVRFRYWKYKTPSPEDVRAGVEVPGSWVARRELGLEELRE